MPNRKVIRLKTWQSLQVTNLKKAGIRKMDGRGFAKGCLNNWTIFTPDNKLVILEQSGNDDKISVKNSLHVVEK